MPLPYVPSAAAEHAAPGQARERGNRKQGPRCVPAVKLVIAEHFGQRSDDRGLAAAWPDRGDIPQRDQGGAGGIGGLELPAADRHIRGSGVPGEGEQFDEIAMDGTYNGHRLLRDDRALETVCHGPEASIGPAAAGSSAAALAGSPTRPSMPRVAIYLPVMGTDYARLAAA